MTLLVATVAGVIIGLSLGALGGGGSILAVPVLVYALGQSPSQATTGSLVVVGLTSLISGVAAYRAGHVLLARGVTFGLVAIGGATMGAKLSAHVPDSVLMAAFAVLMLAVGSLMGARQLRDHRKLGTHHERELHPATVTSLQGGARPRGSPRGHSSVPLSSRPRRALLDDPIITLAPTFACQCPRALKVLVTATTVGLLTGFLGVGGGFVVVPALVLALALPMEYAAGTSLVVITVTSVSAFVVRAGVGSVPDWEVVLALTAASIVGGLVGARLVTRVDTARLSAAFTLLVLGIAVYTASQAVPTLV